MYKVLALLVGLLVIGCGKSENLEMYYKAVENHDTQQAIQAKNTANNIRSLSNNITFDTQAESVMFGVIQAMLLERVKYTPLGVKPPVIAGAVFAQTLPSVLAFANPWLLMWATDSWGSNGSSDVATSINASDGSVVNLDSGNSGSYNVAQEFSSQEITSSAMNQSSCTTGECGEEGEGGFINPTSAGGSATLDECIANPVGFSNGGKPLYSEGCSCESHFEGKC